MPLPGRDAVAVIAEQGGRFAVETLLAAPRQPLGVTRVVAPLPELQSSGLPLGQALASARVFQGCRQPCCGPR